MLTRKAWTAITLHQSGRLATVRRSGRSYTDIATALLNDDAQDDSFINADFFGNLANGVPDSSDIISGVPCAQHSGLEGVEQIVPVMDPAIHTGEVGRWTAILSETHDESCDVSIGCVGELCKVDELRGC